VRFVLKCYEEGMSWQEARNAVQKLNADIGDGWFEAPSNVAYTLIGLLWGKGDFKETLLICAREGDDTDCTCGTAGSTLGIIYGTKGIPEDWCAYIGDNIVTLSLAQGHNGAMFPKTCQELTDRVCRMAHIVLASQELRFTRFITTRLYDIYKVELGDTDEIPEDIYDKFIDLVANRVRTVAESLVPYTMHFENIFLHAQMTLGSAPEIEPEGEISVKLHLQSLVSLEDMPRSVSFRWWLPEGFTVKGRKTAMIPNFNAHSLGNKDVEFVIKAGETVEAENRIVLEITAADSFIPLYCSFPLLG
ncbi:MAG: ADP-ribosylglycohydrolase family protein, partial [Clostridia bacterium]|nr:ADP-ribosylglycohydrolase family protein [Clostridia bacterium]